MKKLMIVALLSFGVLVAGNSFAGIPEPDNPGIKLRLTGDTQADPVRVYKLVRNASRDQNGASMASRDCVVYSTNSDDGVTVALTTTSHDVSVAGILVTAIQTSDAVGSDQSLMGDWGRRNWGWVQVHGPTFAKVTAGGTNGHSAADMWITSSDPGAICTMETLVASNANSLTVGAKSAAGKGGFFFNAATAANTQESVFVDLE